MRVISACGLAIVLILVVGVFVGEVRIYRNSNRPSFQDTEVELDTAWVKPAPVRRSLGIFVVTALLDAIEYVESKGNTNAVGDNGQAIGCMQIHPIMVKDVNRILGYIKYILDDRYDRNKSRGMCKVYMNHYCKGMNLEDMAACWVAGPDGYLQKDKPAVKKYLEKINNYLVSLH